MSTVTAVCVVFVWWLCIRQETFFGRPLSSEVSSSEDLEFDRESDFTDEEILISIQVTKLCLFTIFYHSIKAPVCE